MYLPITVGRVSLGSFMFVKLNIYEFSFFYFRFVSEFILRSALSHYYLQIDVAITLTNPEKRGIDRIE